MEPKKSVITNSIIISRPGETIFYQDEEEDQMFYVTMNGYLLIPIETPIEEISRIIKEHNERKEH